MREGTDLLVVFGLIIAPFVVAMVGLPFLDTDGRTMDVTLKNVSDQDLPYELYVNADLVQEGVIDPGGTAHYQYVKPYGLWNSWKPEVVSVVTPNTVHRVAVERGDDPYFVLD